MYVRDAGGGGLNLNDVSNDVSETVTAADFENDTGTGASSRTGEQEFAASALRFALFGWVEAAARRQAPDVQQSLDAVWEAYGLGYAQGGAAELAWQLRTGDAAFQAELIRRLTEGDSEAAVRILRAAGGEPVP